MCLGNMRIVQYYLLFDDKINVPNVLSRTNKKYTFLITRPLETAEQRGSMYFMKSLNIEI